MCSKTENRMEASKSTLCFVGSVFNTPSRLKSSHESTNSNSIISCCCCCCFVLVLVVVVLEVAVVRKCSGIVGLVRTPDLTMMLVVGVLVLVGRVAGRSGSRF